MRGAGPVAPLRRVRQRGARFVRGLRGDGDSVLAARRSGRLYLSFDDGPDERWTPLVLDELSRAGARATFFVIGERAARHPDLIGRALAEGHEVELHCMRHVRHTLRSRAEVEADTDEGLAVLWDLGARPRRLRPPFAVAEWWTEELAAQRGLRVTGASCDPRDWSGAGVSAALEAARPDLKAGNVAVLHDGREAEGSREDTVALVGPLVEEVRRRGLEPAPLGDGPAFWWLRTTPRPDPAVSFELVEEGELRPADRDQAFALLAENISRAKADYAERGYRLVRPLFRVLARHRGRVVGHTSVGPLRTEPDIGLLGLCDGAVEPRMRRRGIGAAMMHACLAECLARGAGGVLADTTAYAAWCRRHGFRRPAEGELQASRQGQWWIYRPHERSPFRLLDDDF